METKPKPKLKITIYKSELLAEFSYCNAKDVVAALNKIVIENRKDMPEYSDYSEARLKRQKTIFREEIILFLIKFGVDIDYFDNKID